MKTKSNAPVRAHKLKALCMAVAVTLAVGGAPMPASAGGVPVIDVAAIAEAIKQYQQGIEQLAKLQAQLDQAKQMYDSTVGGRGMENILADEVRNVIPSNWQETLAQMNGGQNLSSLAQQIKASASKLDANTLRQLVPEATFEASEGWANSAASAQASAGTVYDNAAGRYQRLKALMDAIPGATDTKAIADLNARINVEMVMLQNESIQMQALAQAAVAQKAIEEQQVRELVQDKPSTSNSLRRVVR